MTKRFHILAAGLCACISASTPGHAQEAIDSHAVIRTETRLVLVDSVVTDKKGAYVHDLTQKDFKVWEDNKEQTISSFSFLAGPDAPRDLQKRYLVLFFDNSTAGPQQQIYARQAAAKFIDANAGPNRLMSIVEFGGTLRVAQNFTDDADRLKKVVAGVKFSSVSPNGATFSPSFANFSTRTVLGALRDVAKGLNNVPGRKTLVFLSAGFPMREDVISEVTATIDACNRANVAIYPIDVRGLVAAAPIGLLGRPGAGLAGLSLLDASLLMNPLAFQVRGGGGTPTAGGGSSGGSSGGGAPRAPISTGGGTSGGGRGGGVAPISTGGGKGPAPTGGGGSTPTANNNNNLNSTRPGQYNPNLRQILPPIDNSITGNQQVLYALANGTGGFVIVNTNDLLGGLQKIGSEQNEYYILGYTPSKELEPGACHTIKVKVDRGGANVRSRTGYCDAKTADVLSGTPTERELEARVNANATPTVTATMQTPFFYTGPDTVRVNVALDIPPGSLKFAKDKGKFRSTLNVLGIAYLPDGGVAARFSDSVRLAFDDKKEAEAFDEKPFHYQKQFEMATGKYNLKVVFSAAANSFGKLETPLVMEPWQPSEFSLSGLALSKQARTTEGGDVEADLIEDRVPMIVNGVRVTPSGTNRFSKSEHGFIYAEIYEPAMADPDGKSAPALAVKLQILDGKTGAVKTDLGISPVNAPPPTGNPAVPVGLVLDIPHIDPGSWKVQVTALDGAGHEFVRAMDFVVE